MNIIPLDAVEVSKDYDMKAGDILYVRVKSRFENLWAKSTIAYYAEKHIAKDSHFELVNINYVDEPGYFIYKLKVLGTPVHLAIALVAGITVLGVAAMAMDTAKTYVVENRKTSQYEAITSGNATPEDIIKIEDAQTKAALAQDNSIGGQIQKAGTGVLMAVLAAGGLLYYFKKRRG